MKRSLHVAELVMFARRTLMTLSAVVMLILLAPDETAAAEPQAIKTDPARLARIRAAKMPEIAEPVMFNTAEANAILSAPEVFPPDNP